MTLCCLPTKSPPCTAGARTLRFLQTLRLTLHADKAQIFPVKNGLNFLGWRIFPHYRRLRRENLRHALQRLKRQHAAFARGELAPDRLTASVRAWLAHAAHGDTYQLRRRVMRRFVFTIERRSHIPST